MGRVTLRAVRKNLTRTNVVRAGTLESGWVGEMGSNNTWNGCVRDNER